MLHVVSYLYRYRVAAACASIGFAALMVTFVPELEIDNSIESYFSEDDPVLHSYLRSKQEFGAKDVVVLALHGETDGTRGARLAEVSRLSRALQKTTGVSRVTSLSTLLAAYARFPSVGSDPVRRLHESAEDGGLAQRLISTNRKTSVILLELDTLPDSERPTALARIRRVVEAETDASFSMGGVAVLEAAVNESMRSDATRFVLLSYLIIAAAFIVIVRSVLWTLLALVVVTLANGVTLGAMALLGRPITLLAIAVPTLIMVLGVANIVHIALHVERTRRLEDLPSSGILIGSLAFVAWPCLFNALSTVAGFLSLQTASLGVTRDYGLFAAIGIWFSFLFSLIGAAFVLPYASRSARKRSPADMLAGAAAKVVKFGWSHKYAVLVSALVISIAAAYAASKIVADTSILNLLPKGHTVQVESRRLEATVGPYLPLDFDVRVRTAGAWQDPAFLQALARASRAVAREENTGPPISILDPLREIRAVTTGRPVASDWTPISPDQVDAYLALGRQRMEESLFDRLVSDDGRTLRYSVTLPPTTGRGVDKRARRIQDILQTELQDQAEVEPSGYLPLFAAFSTHIAGDQARGLSVAIVIVLVLIGVALRSAPLTAIALPSNLMPILIMLGIMGVSSIYLDLATVTVATSVIGIIVDDSVHILYRLRTGLKEGLPVEEALDGAARTAGAAVLSTTLIFCAGFAILAFADIRQVANIGMLTGVTVFAALVTDLIVLPALAALLYSKPRRTRPACRGAL